MQMLHKESQQSFEFTNLTDKRDSLQQLTAEQKEIIDIALKELSHQKTTAVPQQLESPGSFIVSPVPKEQVVKMADNSPYQFNNNTLSITQSIADTMKKIHLKETANPAPLGLIGFGMTTLLLNIHNVGHYPASAMICGMGIFVGGIAQIIAGIFEFLKNNTFGQTAFIGYGCFWLSLVTIWVFPGLPTKANTIAPNELAMGWYLFAWGIYTLVLFFGTLRMNRMLQVVFSTLVCCFMLLAIGKWADNLNCIKAAGWIGIVCGSTAMYGAVSQIINEIYGMTIMPLGIVKKKTTTTQSQKI